MSSDSLHFVHSLLGLGVALSNIAVAYGVWLERDSSPAPIQRWGWRILLAALVAEAIFAFSILGVDKLIDNRQSNRTLSASAVKTLVSAMSQFPGQRVTITSASGDPEADSYAREFYTVIQSAHWVYSGPIDHFYKLVSPGPIGVEITVNEADAKKGRGPLGYNALLTALHQLGIVNPAAPNFVNAAVPPDVIEIRIGTKPLTPGGTE